MKLFEVFSVDVVGDDLKSITRQYAKIRGVEQFYNQQALKLAKELEKRYPFLSGPNQYGRKYVYNKKSTKVQKIPGFTRSGDKVDRSALYIEPAEVKFLPAFQDTLDQLVSILARKKKTSDEAKATYDQIRTLRNTDIEQRAGTNKTISAGSIPERFNIGGPGKIHNPYFKWKNKYAGHPIYYPDWTRQSKDAYFELNNLLQEYGVPEFNIMYASSQPDVAIEFMLIGADNKFFWRKYGQGMGAKNTINVGDRLYATQDFLNLVDEDYKEIFQLIGY